MAELRISTRKILKLFAAVNKREKELAGAAMAEEAKSGENKGNNASQANSTRSTPSLNKRRADGRGYASATGFYVGQFIGKDDAPPPLSDFVLTSWMVSRWMAATPLTRHGRRG